MELGWALGNRSICLHLIQLTKKIINNKIKHRESFRPFAPSILKDLYNKYYQKNHDSPFMLIATFLKLNDIRLKKDIIATLHNDFSARVQTVSKNTNKEFF